MKKFLALALALSLALPLVACGEKNPPAASNPPANSGAPAQSAPVGDDVDYSGYTIRIYSNSNSTERTTWLINEARDAGFTISIDDNSVISGDTAAIQAANEAT